MSLLVENVDAVEGVGDFLAVSADILNWSSADEAGDFAESFDAGEILLAGVFDYGIPWLAPHDFESGLVAIFSSGNAAHAID